MSDGASPLPSDRPGWQSRVIDERAELGRRLKDLGAFINGSPMFKALPEADRALLQRQALAMIEYADTLDARIARF